MKGGQMYCKPAGERTSSKMSTISSINLWEQAFRIVAHLYTKAFPKKAAELMQYNYMIHSASQSYAWDNVYAYDKDFRYHMGKNPGRNWGIVLQQAWNMYMRNGTIHQGGKLGIQEKQR